MDEMDRAEIWSDIFVFVLVFLDRLNNYSGVFTTWFNIQWVCMCQLQRQYAVCVCRKHQRVS